MTIYAIGVERNGNEITSLAEAQALFAIGYRSVLVWTSAWAITSAAGVLDFAGLSALDQTISNLRNGGFEDITLKLCGVPPWMTDTGKNTYGKYTQGPWSYDLNEAGDAVPGTAKFDPELDCVKNPSRVRPASSRWIARKLVERYYARPISRGQKPVINGLSCGNEYELGDYWPPVFALRNEDGGFAKAFRSAWDDFIRPFSDGMRDAVPQGVAAPPLIGPEVAYTSGLQAFLEFDTHDRRFAAISFHGYAEEQPQTLDNSLAHLDEMVDLAHPFADGRAMRMSEIGVEPWIVDYLSKAREKHPDISMTLHSPATMFDPQAYSQGRFDVLSPAGKAVKQFLAA